MNKVRKLITSTLLLALLAGCQSTGIEHVSQKGMFLNERLGIKKYLAGEYQQAFELLSETARWGLKESQYFLAFMFMKGQHVEQSSVLGMAWLGVANEVGKDDWQHQYNSFYQAATPEIRARIDAKQQEYIAKYGLKAQRMTCSEQSQLDSAKPKLRCSKSGGVTTLYPIELTE